MLPAAARSCVLVAVQTHPVFPTGGEVEGNIHALLRAEPVLLLLSAHIRVEQDQRGRVLVLCGLPPHTAPDGVATELGTCFYRFPYPDMPTWRESSFSGVHWRGDPSSPVVEAEFTSSVDEQARLPQPAAATLREWIAALGADRARRNIDQVRTGP